MDIEMKTKVSAAALAVLSSRTAAPGVNDCGAEDQRNTNGGAFAPSYTHGLRPDALGRTSSSCLATFEWISAVSFRQ